MKSIHPRSLITRRSKLITSFFFVILFSAYISVYAIPPLSPYTPGATLDPTCAPMSANCYVGITSSQWTTNGSDIYYNTGKVGIGISSPSALLHILQSSQASVSGTNGTSNTSPLTILGGNGGNTSLSVGVVSGGNAGNVNITAGNGGSTTGSPATGVGGTGGSINLLAGDGGLGTTIGGQAGDAVLQGGTAGNGTSSGIAGYAALKGGLAASTGNGDGGNVYISPGIGNGTGHHGTTFLGVSPSLSIRGNTVIGATTDDYTNVLQVTGNTALTGRLGIGTTTPGEMLSLGLAGTTKGVLSLAGDTSGKIIIQPQSTAGTYNFNLPTTAGTAGQFLTSQGGAGSPMTWTTPATPSTRISALLAANASNSINNAGFNQTWTWDQSLSSSGFTIAHTDPYMGTGATLFEIISSGTGATGSNTYYNFKSSISKNNSPGSNVNIAAYFTATGGVANYAAIFDQGNVGIGQTTPGFKLHVGSSSVTDGTTLLRLQDTNSTCDFNANAGAPSCGSDLTLKKDISSLSTSDLLSKVSNLNPVSYHWLTEESSANLQYGFIAQEVATQFPELVTDHTWIDGTTRKFLNTGGLMPYVVGAIKEMNLRVGGLSSLDTTNSNSIGSLIKQFLGNIGNSLDVVFFGEVRAKKLCLEDVCVTKDQLQQLLTNANIGGSGGGNTPPTSNDVCPNVDGEQATIPSGMHLDEQNNCVADTVTPPPTDGNTPPSENPPPSDNSTPPADGATQ